MNATNYEKHFESIYGKHGNDYYTPKIIDEILDNLITCLPNGGKLYKFRKLDTDTNYNNTRKSLKYGYLWLSRADQFDDETDSTVLYDRSIEKQTIIDMFKRDPILLYKHAMRTFDTNQQGIVFNRDMLFEIADHIDVRTGKLNKTKAELLFHKYQYDEKRTKIGVALIQNYIMQYIFDNQEYIDLVLEFFSRFNDENRKHFYICSLCEDYKDKPMWNIYAGRNGICVEYDYNRVRYLSDDIRKKFISTLKVIYDKNKEQMFLCDGVESLLKYNIKKCHDHDMMKKMGRNILTKDPDYDYEKEWRIVTFNKSIEEEKLGYELKANIISSVIFKESTLSTDQGKRILELCNQHHWQIKVRVLNAIGTDYEYISYDEYLSKSRDNI